MNLLSIYAKLECYYISLKRLGLGLKCAMLSSLILSCILGPQALLQFHVCTSSIMITIAIIHDSVRILLRTRYEL